MNTLPGKGEEMFFSFTHKLHPSIGLIYFNIHHKMFDNEGNQSDLILFINTLSLVYDEPSAVLMVCDESYGMPRPFRYYTIFFKHILGWCCQGHFTCAICSSKQIQTDNTRVTEQLISCPSIKHECLQVYRPALQLVILHSRMTSIYCCM